MHTTTFITIAIATLMISATQANKFEKRDEKLHLSHAFGGDPFYNSGALGNFDKSKDNGFKAPVRRDIQVVGLPGTGTSGGKMVTSTGYGTGNGGSSGFYNKRGGVKVHPERKRALSLIHNKRGGLKVHPERKRTFALDTPGPVTSGGFGTMKINTSATFEKRAASDKVHSEPKKATEKPCDSNHSASHEKRSIFPILGGLLDGNPFLDASEKSYRKRSGKKSHRRNNKGLVFAKDSKVDYGKRSLPITGDILDGKLSKNASDESYVKRDCDKAHHGPKTEKPCKNKNSDPSHGKRTLPIVSDVLSSISLEANALKGSHEKRTGVKVHPSGAIAMKKRDLVETKAVAENETPEKRHTYSSEKVQFIIPYAEGAHSSDLRKRGASDNHVPSNAHPDRPEDYKKDIIVINNSGGKV